MSFFTTATLTLATTVALAATPALAGKPPQPRPETAHYDAATKRICLEVPPATGSRIYTRECMTEQQWNLRGLTFTRVARTERPAQP